MSALWGENRDERGQSLNEALHLQARAAVARVAAVPRPQLQPPVQTQLISVAPAH